MKIDILKRPANAAAKIALDAGESIVAEGGSMIAMSDDMSVSTSILKRDGKGGGAGAFLKGLGRMLGGERMFMNEFTAGSKGGDLYLSTTLPGDMEVISLDGSKPVYVQKGSFVAHEQSIDMNIHWGGLKNVFSGESLIWLKMEGTGHVVVNAFGAVYAVQVDGDYVVDTGNIAAYEGSLEFKVTKAGKSLVGSFAGGEGFVCRFSGQGIVWCQTHADRVFGAKLAPLLTPKKQ